MLHAFYGNYKQTTGHKFIKKIHEKLKVYFTDL